MTSTLSFNALKYLAILFTLFFQPVSAQALDDKSLSIAVASNFILPMKELASLFEEQSLINIKLSYGSSGNLHSQIVNGAPYQLFFSADQEKPKALVEAKIASKNSRFTYAIGKLALWSPLPNIDVKQIFLSGAISRLAMANPVTAPYGMAAKSVLKNLNLIDQYSSKKVYGQNIAQSYLYTSTQNTDLGFVSMSQVLTHQGSIWSIPPELYQPIRQDVVIIKKFENNQNAWRFLNFIQSSPAKKIIIRYGYSVIRRY